MNYSQILESSTSPLFDGRTNSSTAQKFGQQYKIAQFLKNNRFFYSLSVFLAECSLRETNIEKDIRDHSPDRFAKLIFKIHADLESKYKDELQNKVKTINETYALEYSRCKKMLMIEMENNERKLKKLYGSRLDALDERESVQKEYMEQKEKEFFLETEEQRRMLIRRFELISNKQKNLQFIEKQLKNRIETENEKLNKREIELENLELDFEKRVMEFDLHRSDIINKGGETKRKCEKKNKVGNLEGELNHEIDHQRKDNQASQQKSVIEIEDLAKFIAKLTKPPKVVCAKCHCREKNGSITALENYKAEVEKEIGQIQHQLRYIQTQKNSPGRTHSSLNRRKNSLPVISDEEQNAHKRQHRKNITGDQRKFELQENGARSSSEDNNSDSYLPDFVNDAEKRLRKIDNDTKDLNEMIEEYVKNQLAQSQAKVANPEKFIRKTGLSNTFKINAQYRDEVRASDGVQETKNNTKLMENKMLPYCVDQRSEKSKVPASEPIDVDSWESRLKLREQQRLQRMKELDKAAEVTADIEAIPNDKRMTSASDSKPVATVEVPKIDPLLEQYMKVVAQQKAEIKQTEEPATEHVIQTHEEEPNIHQKDDVKESSSDFEW